MNNQIETVAAVKNSNLIKNIETKIAVALEKVGQVSVSPGRPDDAIDAQALQTTQTQTKASH